MRLFHFTDPELLPSIRERGLVPRAIPRAMNGLPEHLGRLQTNGAAVVWLTQSPAEWEGARLTVNLEPNSKRLHHYTTWAARFVASGALENARNYAIARGHTALELEKWYVYLGTIPPGKIEGMS